MQKTSISYFFTGFSSMLHVSLLTIGGLSPSAPSEARSGEASQADDRVLP